MAELGAPSSLRFDQLASLPLDDAQRAQLESAREHDRRLAKGGRWQRVAHLPVVGITASHLPGPPDPRRAGV